MASNAVKHFPVAVVIPAALAITLLVLPIVALASHASLDTLWGDITSPLALTALRISLTTALTSTALCLLLGVPLALLIARSPAKLAAVLRVLVSLPLVLPPIVGGVSLLFLFGRNSLLGRALEETWGVSIPFTTLAVILAQTFVALPFLVLTVEAKLSGSGLYNEESATTLGANKWQVLTLVTLPIAAPGIFAGSILSFARALGEFGATAIFAGNAPGVTQTMPIAIYSAFNGGADGREPAVALSLLLLITAVIVLFSAKVWRPDSKF